MQDRRGRVVVAGSINMDVMARVARQPQPGETVAGTDLHFYPGGKGANQAVAAARLGARTMLLGRLGADAFGSELYAFLHEQAIDLRFTQRTEAAPTGTALVVVDDRSENSIVVVPGANGMLRPEDTRGFTPHPADVCVSQLEIPADTAAAFLQHGRDQRATTILNATPAGRCRRALLGLADVLVLNETELAVLAAEPSLGTNDELLSRVALAKPDDGALVATASRVRTRVDQAVIVTLGANGAIALQGDRVQRIAGRRVQAVDTTGAGDCFVGALAARLAAGATLPDAAGFANVAASLCVQAHGAGPSMPDIDSVLAALREPA